jgi:putative phosphoribosyl transferase
MRARPARRKAMSTEKPLSIPVEGVSLEGNLAIPDQAVGLVIFAHGAGSSRLSPRNNYVARLLQQDKLGTLLLDLLTPQEDLVYENRFDIDLISRRMTGTTLWVKENTEARDMAIGYFGASTGSAAALKASVQPGVEVGAIVSRGGRPDLVEDILPQVKAPTLLIVGGDDTVVMGMNEQAYALIGGVKDFKVVRGASHLFEEPGKLDVVALLASGWFKTHLGA